MIYKFKLEVCNDDNEFIYGIGKESGNFKWAFIYFIKIVTDYAVKLRLHQ